MDCRVCSLLSVKPVPHDEARLHSDAPAIPIATLVTARLGKSRRKI